MKSDKNEITSWTVTVLTMRTPAFVWVTDKVCPALKQSPIMCRSAGSSVGLRLGHKTSANSVTLIIIGA